MGWDSFTGEAEGVLLYYDGKITESIRGNQLSGSKDGNIEPGSGLRTEGQQFTIENSRGKLINVWLLNSLADEDLSTEDDFSMLANSRAFAVIKNIKTNRSWRVDVPEGEVGLAYHAGMIVDGVFVPVERMYSRLGIVKIHLVDAVNGKLLEGGNINIIDPRVNQRMASGVTDAQGSWEAKLGFGKFRALIDKDKYIGGYYDFNIEETELPFFVYFAMPPKFDKIRVVLTWGASPRDLDAHLAGPDPSGGRFHISYRNKREIGGKNFLDRDDTSGYGPETITIYKPAQGVYYYAVYDYTNRNAGDSKSLSYSNATVSVYKDNALAAQFKPGPQENANYWVVFKINEKYEIVPVNQYGISRDHQSIIR